jgi:peptidoglycan/LPS O-acetylase OafA/YrhL
MTIPTTPRASAYRADIDGLRAIAVLAVIIFHINKSLIPGGFVGVDVFFVISGFLISLHLLRDLEHDKFSLLDFYRRRVKRLALPLFVVLVITMLAAAVLMIPSDFKHAADSALFALLSLANVYFWLFQDSSYFAVDSTSLPLLHLWSLGVEEQFYIFWPLLLMFTYRRSRLPVFVWLAGVAAMASFVFAEIWFQHDASFTYYMLPARAGELLLGAWVAMLVLREVPQRVAKVWVTPLAATGLLLLIVALVSCNEDQVFPGWRALLPTGGAALLIFAGQCGRNRISQALQFEPLVWIGLISYSAYLWHWPLLAMLRYEHIQIGFWVGSLVFVGTIWLAFLSYMLVEEPARFWDATLSRIFIFQYIAPACLIALLLIMGKIYLGKQFVDANSAANPQAGAATQTDPEHVPVTAASGVPKVIKTMAEIDTGLHEKPRPAFEFTQVCIPEHVDAKLLSNPRCITGAPLSSAPRVLLWGDSNAAHYVDLLASIARHAGFNFRNVATYSCPPLLSDAAPYVLAKRLNECRAAFIPIQKVLENDIDVVILAGHWPDYAAHSSKFFSDLFATAAALSAAGKLVVIMGKAPTMSGFDINCKEKLHYMGSTLKCAVAETMSLDVESANAQLKEFAEHTPNVTYFDVSPYLCKDGICSAYDAADNPLYYDTGHLSVAAAGQIGDSIVRQTGTPKAFAGIVPWLNHATKKQ